MSDLFVVGEKKFNSRLLTGSGKYSRDSLISEVCESSKSEIITLALRRIDLNNPVKSLLDYIPKNMQLLPNTSGARTWEEAVKIARIARDSGCGNWIKIEIIRDNKYLMPDGLETIKATEILAKEGFIVLPYINGDYYIGKSLENAGAAAVMPLGSPIGSNRGIKCKELISILIETIKIPVIVDAGIGKPSDAALVMEMGADACLINSAIASSPDPVLMANAFALAIESGRKAYLAGLGHVKDLAQASSPLTGFLYE
ncbi:MAG: thiazole synthase [Spirochaetales bacterium]|nr:thiazole synthase [Spirochaetales bacterium]